MTSLSEMESFIETDRETYLAFQALTRLVARNTLKYRGCLKQARKALLESMIEKGCYENMKLTQDFITYNYSQLEVLGDSLAPLDIKRRLRSYSL